MTAIVSAVPVRSCKGASQGATARSDDFSDSFRYRAIRTRIGDALRAQYDVSEPLPRTLLTLLMQLDGEPKENAPRAPGEGSIRFVS
jgi:hypothetical protein